MLWSACSSTEQHMTLRLSLTGLCKVAQVSQEFGGRVRNKVKTKSEMLQQ